MSKLEKKFKRLKNFKNLNIDELYVLSGNCYREVRRRGMIGRIFCAINEMIWIAVWCITLITDDTSNRSILTFSTVMALIISLGLCILSDLACEAAYRIIKLPAFEINVKMHENIDIAEKLKYIENNLFRWHREEKSEPRTINILLAILCIAAPGIYAFNRIEGYELQMTWLTGACFFGIVYAMAASLPLISGMSAIPAVDGLLREFIVYAKEKYEYKPGMICEVWIKNMERKDKEWSRMWGVIPEEEYESAAAHDRDSHE